MSQHDTALTPLTLEPDQVFWDQLTAAIAHDPGEAARAHWAAGQPIYYGDPAYPGVVVKHYPDGQRQLVCFTRPAGTERVLQDLAACPSYG